MKQKQKCNNFAVSCGPTTSGLSHSKKHLEQMLKGLIEEAAKVDLEPKLASLGWTSTYAFEEKEHDFGYIKTLLQTPF